MTSQGADRLYKAMDNDTPENVAKYVSRPGSFKGVPPTFDLVSAITQHLVNNPRTTSADLTQHVVEQVSRHRAQRHLPQPLIMRQQRPPGRSPVRPSEAQEIERVFAVEGSQPPTRRMMQAIKNQEGVEAFVRKETRRLGQRIRSFWQSLDLQQKIRT